MKKLILILLCLPLFLFSQEEYQYTRTMSVSQFAKELKQAADKGIDYTLEDCEITYHPITDKEYVIDNLNIEKFEGHALIRDLQFSDSSKVSITNCKFGDIKELPKYYTTTLQFKSCTFGELNISSIDVSEVHIKESNINSLRIYFDQNRQFVNSTHEFIVEVIDNRILHMNVWGAVNEGGLDILTEMYLDSNDIGHCRLYNWESSYISANKITTLQIAAGDKYDRAEHYISENIFNADITNAFAMWLNLDETNKEIYGSILYPPSLAISSLKGQDLYITDNTFNYKRIHNDTIFNKLLFQYKNKLTRNKEFIAVTKEIQDSSLQITSKNYSSARIYNDSLKIEEKISFLKQYFKENKLNFRGVHTAEIEMRMNTLEKFWMFRNSATFFTFLGNQINTQLSIEELTIDTLNYFRNNTFPDYNRVHLDKTILNNLGFTLNSKRCYGNEKFTDIDTSNLKNYNQKINGLISQYRQFINIFTQTGNELKSHSVMKLKNVQTNQRMFQYYEDSNTNTWFNWQGSVFLKWYSDYGMNPFKALTYCFWAMLFFAMFYFIFYNDWDKIDRGFLIKRFNSVMDYFTTEKRIEDFYSSTHDKEMTTFTEFKNTLDKNKVHMPSMLASLAKPIYQISLLRYKLLSFSYKKAEFMAGRKWANLEKKDRYLIGTLTFFLTFTYIIYLVFIRALNSVVLSINAFSTLGFGQIPVRGFTKYVAIIEGFIGWFMLSVFIVSLLSQMMTV